MIRAHARAVEALLNTATNLVWFDGDVDDPDTSGPYAVYFLSTAAGVDQSRRVSADVPKARFTLAVMYVGDTPDEMRWVAEKVRTALIRNRLSVAGRTCDPFLPPSSSATPRKDDSAQPIAWVATDVWQFNSSAI